MNSALKFSVRKIKDRGGLVFEGPAPADIFAEEGLLGEAVMSGPCAVALEFSVGGANILLEARVEGRWTMPCSRCLAPHEAGFAAGFEETYPATQETIDVADEVRQAVVLQVPARSLCGESCRGLCPRCGKNLNSGPCGCRTAPAADAKRFRIR